MTFKILQNEILAPYVSWKVGGPADHLFIPQNLSDLSAYLKQLPNNTNVFFLGLGSNLLIRDKGIRGVVIATQKMLNHFEMVEDDVIRAEAGVSCGTLARFAARNGLSGIEFLAGIPGTIGGALAMNAGCAGSETWLHVSGVELIDKHGQVKRISADEFSYGYRYVSIPEDHWFVAGYFKLSSEPPEKCLQKIRELLDYRTATQPINQPSCGSTFRNPEGTFAGKLIEKVGLKGYCLGGAMVSPKHANFIVNLGHSTAADIENLIYYIKEQVMQKTGIELTLEVKIVGE